MNYEMSALQRLEVENAQLKFVITNERATATVKEAMDERDRIVLDIFRRIAPEERLEDFSIDMDSGVFKDNRVEEEKSPDV